MELQTAADQMFQYLWNVLSPAIFVGIIGAIVIAYIWLLRGG